MNPPGDHQRKDEVEKTVTLNPPRVWNLSPWTTKKQAFDTLGGSRKILWNSGRIPVKWCRISSINSMVTSHYLFMVTLSSLTNPHTDHLTRVQPWAAKCLTVGAAKIHPSYVYDLWKMRDVHCWCQIRWGYQVFILFYFGQELWKTCLSMVICHFMAVALSFCHVFHSLNIDSISPVTLCFMSRVTCVCCGVVSWHVEWPSLWFELWLVTFDPQYVRPSGPEENYPETTGLKSHRHTSTCYDDKWWIVMYSNVI